MKVTTAMALINGLIYKPGWTIEVESYCHRFEESIKITLCCDTYRSEREEAAEGYPSPIRPRASFVIMVGDKTDDCSLYRAVLDKIIEYETHEAREFLRVGTTLWAPFHPHQTEGSKRWGTPESDYTFGTV